jgi:hypothetical protein
MTGSERTFTYTLLPAPESADRVLKQAEKILAWVCEGDARVTCHGISGEALGAITLNLTIKGRDQWWCRQLAQDIINLVTWGLKSDATKLDLQSHRQAAHTHRGYSYGRTKPFRQSRTTEPPASPRPDPDARMPL